MSPSQPRVLRVADLPPGALGHLLESYGMLVETLPDGAPIPGSHWGEPEAGLVAQRLLVRADTPVHSALHEASHYICMTPERRARLTGDAGGDYDEENAVCFLQIVLADQLAGVGRVRLMADMDAWGYSFRLGSTRAWFEEDSGDARAWLVAHGLLGPDERPTGALRSSLRPARVCDSERALGVQGS
jgi:hypothetical protein